MSGDTRDGGPLREDTFSAAWRDCGFRMQQVENRLRASDKKHHMGHRRHLARIGDRLGTKNIFPALSRDE